MKNAMLLKPKMKVYVLLLIAAVGVMVALYRCSHSMNVGNTAIASGGDTIDVAVEYSPLSLYMYDDTLGGFNHDLIMLIMQRENVVIKMHPMVKLAESLELLDKGVYDIVAAQLPVTSEFRKKYLFSDSIYIDRQVLLQLKDSVGNCSVKSQLDIAGKTLHVVSGSPVVTRIKNLSREIGDSVNVIEEKRYGQEQLFLMVATGDIQYAVISQKVAKAMASDYPKVDIGTAVSFNQFQSWAFRKDDYALRDSVNNWLNHIRTTPVYTNLYNRYF